VEGEILIELTMEEAASTGGADGSKPQRRCARSRCFVPGPCTGSGSWAVETGEASLLAMETGEVAAVWIEN
jgi:hypothetical protein